MLRLPDGMRDRIKAAAAENNRSMNAEIVATLEEKYPPPDPQTDYEFRMQRSEEILAEMTEIIAGYEDPTQDVKDLARRFEVLKEEHAWLFPAPSPPP